MIHSHKIKKGMLYIHTIQWFLIEIRKENFSLSDLENYFLEWTLTDIYWNDYRIEKDKIDIAFDDERIYHNFHNEQTFIFLKEQSKWIK